MSHVAGQKSRSPVLLAFMSSVCPRHDVPGLLALARTHGYAGFFSVEVINPPEGEPVIKAHALWFRNEHAIIVGSG